MPNVVTGYWRNFDAVSVRTFVEGLQPRALKGADEGLPLWEQVQELMRQVCCLPAACLPTWCMPAYLHHHACAAGTICSAQLLPMPEG